MSDGIGLAEATLGLDGFGVLEVTERPDTRGDAALPPTPMEPCARASVGRATGRCT
jgi:hypothetical protein